MRNRYSLSQQEIEIVQLRRKLAEYENDSERVTLIAKYGSEVAKLNAQIVRLKESSVKTKEKYEAQILSLKEKLQISTDKNKEYTAELSELSRKYTTLKHQYEILRQQRKSADEEVCRLRGLLFEKEKIITENNAFIDSLKLRINKNSENSSLPSSQNRPYHKRANTFNGRVKDPAKSQGAQKGHKHCARKNIAATHTVLIPPSADILSNADLYATKETVIKKLIGLKFCVDVTEFITPVYRSRSTGARIHAPFPKGLTDEITYDSGIDSIVLWLTNYCNVSIRKTKDFLGELTDGKISPSVGYINGLLKRFGKRSENEYATLYDKLIASEVMNLDSTGCNVNGKNKRLFVFTNGNEAYFAFREGKTLKDLENTPVDGFTGALVHDHETAFYRFGNKSLHQECIAHILRYLKAAIEENPNLTWHKSMHEFFIKLIRTYHNDRDSIVYEQVMSEYNNLLSRGKYEYSLHPPNKYLREGEKLLSRLEKYAQENFLFLKHPNVPHTNNICERLLRNIKRKVKQAVAFRSPESVKALCEFLSIIETAKMKALSPFRQITLLLSK